MPSLPLYHIFKVALEDQMVGVDALEMTPKVVQTRPCLFFAFAPGYQATKLLLRKSV